MAEREPESLPLVYWIIEHTFEGDLGAFGSRGRQAHIQLITRGRHQWIINQFGVSKIEWTRDEENRRKWIGHFIIKIGILDVQLDEKGRKLTQIFDWIGDKQRIICWNGV